MIEDFSELSMCAVRYALGRMTYVSWSVPHAIYKHKEYVTNNALHVMLRDIREYRNNYGKIGMDFDDESWTDFETWLEKEIEWRTRNGWKQESENC